MLANLDFYFQSSSTLDININADGSVFVLDFFKGKIKTGITLDENTRNSAARILASYNEKYINEENYSAPGIYYYKRGGKIAKARVQLVIPPVTTGTMLCFRLQSEKSLDLKDYLDQQVITSKVYDFLIGVIKSKKNVIVAGSTGSGKTTLLNAMLKHLDNSERVFVIEDTEEINLPVEDKVMFLVNSKYDYRAAVKDSLRCSPERIIVGEVRDGAALDLLKAWNTGHRGGLATIHANSAGAVPDRLKALCEEVVLTASPELIVEALDLVIFLRREAGKVILDEILESKKEVKNGVMAFEPVKI